MILMTYNIQNGGVGRMPSLLSVILQEGPSVLLLNEMSEDYHDPAVRRRLGDSLSLPYSQFARSGSSNNHLVAFSKYPMEDVYVMKGFHNAAITFLVKTGVGDVCVAGVHLAPHAESVRFAEIQSIISHQRQYDHAIIFGDMNAVSPDNSKTLENNLRPNNHKYEYETIDLIKKSSYVDVAVSTNRHHLPTVPLTTDNGVVYHDLRLDYVFLTDALTSHLKDYRVVDTETTRRSSDHFPVVVELQI